MENVKEYNCAKCGAQVWKGEHKEYILICPPYCPHCGALLPLKSAKVTVEEKDLNRIEKNVIELASNLKYSYKSPYARKCDGYNFDTINKILCGDFLENAKSIKKDADRYDTLILWFVIVGICLFPVAIIIAFYFYVREPKTGLEIVKDETTEKYGIFNHSKDLLVTPYEYDSIQYRNWVDAELYKRNYFILFKNTLLGIADSTGTVSISCELDEIEGAYSGLIIMRENGYEGLFDTYGTSLFRTDNYRVLWEKKPAFDYYTPGTYVGNIIPVKRNTNSGWELFNRAGKKIVNKSYPEVIQTGAPDLIKVKFNGYYGLVNTKGEEVIKCKTEKISRFKEGKAVATFYEKNVIIDLQGKEIGSFPRGYKNIWLFNEGLFAKKDLDNNIRFYNEKGQDVFNKVFEQVKEGSNLINASFMGDSARISYQGQNGYVFKDGSIKLDAK